MQLNPFSEVVLNKGRLEALSDGLFAIVMTLLVLELKVPELPKPVNDQELLHKLRELWPAFFSYAITFLLSGAFWILHHLSFHYIRHTTKALCWINLFFLMFVSLLPFSTAMMGHYLSHPIALFAYFGNQTLVGLALLVHWRYALSHDLVPAESDRRAVDQLSTRITMLPTAFAAAVAMTAVRPTMATTAFIVVVLIFRVKEIRSRRNA